MDELERKQRIEKLRKELEPALERLDRGEGIELDEESLGPFLEEIKAEGDRLIAEKRGMTDYIQITTTTETEQDAQAIATALVEQRLAACVQIVGPIRSTYRWKEKIETAREWQCVVKTRRELYERVEEAVKSLHPYEVPEIISVPITAASESYCRWIDEQVG